MNMNKTIITLAASAAVALSATAADVTGYIPLTFSGTVTLPVVKSNPNGLKNTYSSKATTVNNKGVLSLLSGWYLFDGGAAAFATSDRLAVLWDYTTETPVTGDVVVLDKTGVLVYDPATYVPANAGEHVFQVGTLPSDWLTPTDIGGSTSVLPGTGLNMYDDTLGAGTITYIFLGSFTLTDTTTVPGTATLSGQGKGTGTSTFNAAGQQIKAGFKVDTFGTDGTSQDSVNASISLTISSGSVVIAGTGTNQPL